MTDDKAQLDASKSSTVCSGGRLEGGRDVHLAVCNLRAFFLTAIPIPEDCLVFKKLFQYLKVLSSPDGRNWLTAHRHNLAIPVHLYQECQHILGMFLSVASRPTLRATLKDGGTIHVDNYAQAVKSSDLMIDKLRSIVGGNTLGDFQWPPPCLSWFPPLSSGMISSAPSRTPTNSRPTNTRPTVSPDGPSNSRPSDGKKLRVLSQDDINKCKESGLLIYDSVVTGDRKLPPCPVHDKAKGGSTSERLCMQFITRGHYCSRPKCPYPHVFKLASMPEPKRSELIKFVKLTPGLAFAPGQGPPGTPPRPT